MATDFAYYQKSADYIKTRAGFKPEIGLILGSGLGPLADEIDAAAIIPYGDIPNFLASTAPGHAGRLILGELAGRKVACMAGRFHYYEGYAFEQLAAPVRLFKLLGVKCVLLTNAAGAVNTAYKPGDVMLIKDHLNLVGASPMRGPNIEAFGPRFFDAGNIYTPALRALALGLAEKTPLAVHEGIYMYFPGPQFETPAEIRAARLLGADAVGMSTVTEALTAAHCGMPALGLSLITNMAAGVLNAPLSGEEVEAAAQLVAVPFRTYVKRIIGQMRP